jgi:hypothetical protein
MQCEEGAAGAAGAVHAHLQGGDSHLRLAGAPPSPGQDRAWPVGQQPTGPLCSSCTHGSTTRRSSTYDNTLEGQYGDCLFFPDLVLVSVFGTKTDPKLPGQPTTFPSESREAVGLVCNAS